MTRRGLQIAVTFVVLEMLGDAALTLARQRYHIKEGSLWWIDFVVCPLLGLLLVLVGRVRFPAVVGIGAAFGLIDGTLGFWIQTMLGALKSETSGMRLTLSIYGVTIHPLLLMALTAAGAGIGFGLRAMFARPAPS